MYNTIQYNTISHLRFVTFYICALEMLLLSYLLTYLLATIQSVLLMFKLHNIWSVISLESR